MKLDPMELSAPLRAPLLRATKGLTDVKEKIDGTAERATKNLAAVGKKIKRDIDRGVKEGSLKIKHTARKHICGDENLSIRAHIEETSKSPPVVKFVDKLSFTIGVLWLMVTEWWMLLYPETFGKFYSFSISAFIALRYYMYKKEKYQYFLYDMCYFVDFTCILQVWAMPSSWHTKLDVLIPESLRGRAAHAFFLINFSLVAGPLAWAIPLWRSVSDRSLQEHFSCTNTSYLCSGIRWCSILWIK
jgi:hypothetical protein